MPRAAWLAVFLLVAVLGLVSATHRAHAQDMEPRAYSASPIDTNFLVATYAHVAGAASLDPALPIANVRGIVGTGLIGYDRTFDLFGNQASAAILVPAVKAHLRGDVFDAGREITRLGAGDILMRVTENLIGSPALTPVEFMQRTPTTTAGISLTAVAPTGDYNPQHLINISSNRWSFKPEVGFFSADRQLVCGWLGRCVVAHGKHRFLWWEDTGPGTALGRTGACRLQFSPRTLAGRGRHTLFRRRHCAERCQQSGFSVGNALRRHSVGAHRGRFPDKAGLAKLADRP